MKMRIETIVKKLKAQYDSVGKPNHDIMKVVHKGKYGFFNIKGEQIIPFVYDWSSSFVRKRLRDSILLSLSASSTFASLT